MEIEERRKGDSTGMELHWEDKYTEREHRKKEIIYKRNYLERK